jgi:hypothetical protein
VAIRNVIFTIEVILAVLLASASVSCSNIKVKVKLSRCAMKALRRRGSTAVTYSCPRHYMRVSVQCHAPVAFYPWGMITVPNGQEAGWASELVWTQGLEEIYFASAWDRTPFILSVGREYYRR